MKITIIIVLMYFVLSGCASQKHPLADNLQYHPPVSDSSTATIVGSTEQGKSGNFVYIVAVDDKHVMAERAGREIPLTLAAGAHKILVEFDSGNLFASKDIEIVANPGEKYRVEISTDVSYFGEKSFCDFRVIDIAARREVFAVRAKVSRDTASNRPPLILFLPR